MSRFIARRGWLPLTSALVLTMVACSSAHKPPKAAAPEPPSITVAGCSASTANARWQRISFSADGKQLATADGDGCIHIWDVNTLLPILTLTDGSSSYLNVLFSPDGKWLAYTGAANNIRIRNADTGTLLRSIPQAHTKLAWSADSRWLAALDSSFVTVFIATTGEKLGSIPAGPDAHILFTPDGHLVSAGSYAISVWDIVTGHLVRSFQHPASLAAKISDLPPDSIRALSLCCDGKKLVIEYYARPGKLHYIPAPSDFAPHVFTKIVFLDLATGTQSTLDFNKVFFMAVSLDGDKIAFARCLQHQKSGFAVCVYSVKEKRFTGIFAGEKWITDMAFSPDGKLLAVLGQRLSIWHIETGRRLPDTSSARP
jgi:WD40 repeat protein